MATKDQVTKAVIYCRFSPRRNADESESIETQLHYCRAHCAMRGYEIVGEFQDEAISGASAENRPGFQEAIDVACDHHGVLVVYSLSRFARSVRDALLYAQELNDAGANLSSLHEQIDTTTAMGRFTFTLFAALAALEREQTVERTREAMLRHQSAGRRMSAQTPYGWRVDPENAALMIADDEERAVIEQIVRFRAGGHGLRVIGRKLAKRGIDCRGGAWHHTTIKKILERAGVK